MEVRQSLKSIISLENYLPEDHNKLINILLCVCLTHSFLDNVKWFTVEEKWAANFSHTALQYLDKYYKSISVALNFKPYQTNVTLLQKPVSSFAL